MNMLYVSSECSCVLLEDTPTHSDNYAFYVLSAVCVCDVCVYVCVLYALLQLV